MNKPLDFIINLKDSRSNSIFNCAPDLFLNEFVNPWSESFVHESGSYKKTLTILPTEGPDTVDDGRIVYNFNHDGFRSEDFTKTHTGIHILFSGCSNSEGVGSPLETIWTKKLYNQIAQHTDTSGFFSLAKAGHGWQKIIVNFMIYGEKYGFPEFFFVMLPNIARFWDWSPKERMWYHVQSRPLKTQSYWQNYTKVGQDNFLTPRIVTPEAHKKDFINFYFGWKMFQKFCESKGVKMLWGCWDYPESINHNTFQNSKNYVHLTIEESVKFINKARPTGKFEVDDLCRRDGHLGQLEHEYWMTKFLERIKTEKEFSSRLVF